MDKRLYFVLGDLACNVVCGAFVALVCALLFSPGWNMWLAMFLAMGIGMILSLPLWFPASIYFGAMETMVPMMLTGMVSGMVAGMWAAMEPLGAFTALLAGALTGLGCTIVVWLVNHQLRGPKTHNNNRAGA